MTVKIYTITWDDWFKAIKRSRTTSLYILFKFNNKILTNIANLNRTDEKSTIYKVLYKVSLRERTVIINEEIHLDSLLTFFLIILMFLMSIHTN